MAALAEKLNSFLATSSYLGDDICATKEDYRVCASMTSVNGDAHPNLARWHSHVTYLMKNFPNNDYRGNAVPAGKDRAGVGGAPAAASSPKTKAAASPKNKPAASPKNKAAPAPAAAAGAVDEDAVKAVGDELRVVKARLTAEGVRANDHPEVVALVAKLTQLKTGGVPKAKKADAPAKKAEAPAKKEKADAPAAADPVMDAKKKLKATIKEGGKRGVEIEGAADMGGLQFFCTSVDTPDGDLDLVVTCVNAMNEKSDPTEEERKGGSSAIGKMVFSAGTDQLAVVAYVQEAKQGELDCAEWLTKVLSVFNGVLVKGDKELSTGFVKADGDKNIFPLKIREPMILEANNFLRKLGLFPEDNGSDSDEFVFGDDDFPS